MAISFAAVIPSVYPAFQPGSRPALALIQQLTHEAESVRGVAPARRSSDIFVRTSTITAQESSDNELPAGDPFIQIGRGLAAVRADKNLIPAGDEDTTNDADTQRRQAVFDRSSATTSQVPTETQPNTGSPERGRLSETRVRPAASHPLENSSTASPDGDTLDINDLTPSQKSRIRRLKLIDAEVRQHERAHVAAAGILIRRGAQFIFVTGPDGQRYAVGGEVQIDTSGVPDDPEATIRQAQNIRRAALAPARPSRQDRAVAARASQMEFEARTDLAQEKAREAQEARAVAVGYALGSQTNQPQPDEPILDQFV